MAVSPFSKVLTVVLLLLVFILVYLPVRYWSDPYTQTTVSGCFDYIQTVVPTFRNNKNDTGILLPPNSRLVNHVILEYDVRLREKFQRLVDLKVTAEDPRLLSVIMRMLDPPAKTMVKKSRQLIETPQSKAAMVLLKNKVSISDKCLPSNCAGSHKDSLTWA